MGNSKRSAESDKAVRGKPEKAAKAPKAGRKGSAGKASESAPPPSFEVALDQLEGSVARLEEGDMPLEEALALFESGVKLSRQCQSTLEEAERRIEILVANGGSKAGAEASIDFDAGEDPDDESEFED